MSQQPPPSSPEYASPPSNQLQINSADNQLTTQGPPTTFQGKPIEEILTGLTPFNTPRDLEEPFQAEIQCDTQFIHEQSHEFLELALEVWARNMARIHFTTQGEGTRLGKLATAVLDRERQQGMFAPLILSNSARPRRTVFQFCADFLVALCKSMEDFRLQFRSLINSLCGT